MTDSNNLQKLTRKQAKTAGDKIYFDGRPCRRGHTEGRWTTTGACVPCLKKYDRERKRNPSLMKKYRDKALKNNPIIFLLGAAKKRELDATGEFRLKKEDLGNPTHCPVCGNAFVDRVSGNGYNKRHYRIRSIDRIDNTKGYIPGNTAIICWRCNQLKNNGTAMEHRQIADWMDSCLSKS